MRAGIAFFDDPEFLDPTATQGGWCATADGDVNRFARVTDLVSDVIWVTNVEYARYREQRLYDYPNIRNASFLNASLANLQKDLQVGPNECPLHVGAVRMAEVAQRIFDLVLNAYRTEKTLSEFSVSAGVRKVLLPNERPPKGAGLSSALLGAYQKYSRCVLPSFAMIRSKENHYTVRKNRLAHVREVMEVPVPDGEAEFIDEEMMPQSNRLDWLFALGRPFLVKVSISQVDQDIADILSFNARKGESGRKMPREWATSLEAMLLDAYAKVTVHGAWVWEASTPLQPALQLPPSLLQDPWLELSYSVQLVADIHLSALTSTPRLPAVMGGGYLVNPVSVWLGAMDRLLSFDMARHLLKEHVRPMGYGSGSVNVKVVGDEDNEKLMAFVRDAGWAFPIPRQVKHAA